MAPNHDGNEVDDAPMCIHGVAVYWRGNEQIHVGSGVVCDQKPLLPAPDAPTEQITKVPSEWPPPKVIRHWTPPNPHEEEARQFHEAVSEQIAKDLPDLAAFDEEREAARFKSVEERLKGLQRDPVHVAAPGMTREPLFGFHDEEGRSLLEFRVRDGKVEAKYYLSDLDEAAARFLAYLFELQG